MIGTRSVLHFQEVQWCANTEKYVQEKNNEGEVIPMETEYDAISYHIIS